jgi:hypothetical protein
MITVTKLAQLILMMLVLPGAVAVALVGMALGLGRLRRWRHGRTS